MRIKRAPCGHVFIRAADDLWYAWSPNGEYWECGFGDQLNDTIVNDWPEATFEVMMIDSYNCLKGR